MEAPRETSGEHIQTNPISNLSPLEVPDHSEKKVIPRPEQTNTFTSDPEQLEREEETDKNHVTQAVVTMLNQITDWKLAKLHNGSEVSLSEAWELLRENWPNNDGRRKTRFSIPGARNGTSVYFENNANDYDAVSGQICLGIKSILDATTEEEVRNATNLVIEIAYHEVEHIYNPGMETYPDTPQATIEYMGNDGEIKAHARQFAFRYLQSYPGDNFDLIKMRALISPTDINAQNYFVTFTIPEKQEQYRQWGDLAEIHDKVVRETTRMIEMLKLYNDGQRAVV